MFQKCNLDGDMYGSGGRLKLYVQVVEQGSISKAASILALLNLLSAEELAF